MSARDPNPADLRLRYAVIGLLGLLACIVVALGASGLFVLAYDHAGAPASATRALAPPEPRLERAGGTTLAEVQQRGAARLTTWAWTDRQAGLARIPIERAMALTAERGWADQEHAP